MKLAVPWCALALGLSVGACAGGSLKAAGEACTASSECDVGLLCDHAVTPHVCAGWGTSMPVSVDGGGADAPPVDGAPADAPPVDASNDAMIDAAI